MTSLGLKGEIPSKVEPRVSVSRAARLRLQREEARSSSDTRSIVNASTTPLIEHQKNPDNSPKEDDWRRSGSIGGELGAVVLGELKMRMTKQQQDLTLAQDATLPLSLEQCPPDPDPLEQEHNNQEKKKKKRSRSSMENLGVSSSVDDDDNSPYNKVAKLNEVRNSDQNNRTNEMDIVPSFPKFGKSNKSAKFVSPPQQQSQQSQQQLVPLLPTQNSERSEQEFSNSIPHFLIDRPEPTLPARLAYDEQQVVARQPNPTRFPPDSWESRQIQIQRACQVNLCGLDISSDEMKKMTKRSSQMTKDSHIQQHPLLRFLNFGKCSTSSPYVHTGSRWDVRHPECDIMHAAVPMITVSVLLPDLATKNAGKVKVKEGGNGQQEFGQQEFDHPVPLLQVLEGLSPTRLNTLWDQNRICNGFRIIGIYIPYSQDALVWGNEQPRRLEAAQRHLSEHMYIVTDPKVVERYCLRLIKDKNLLEDRRKEIQEIFRSIYIHPAHAMKAALKLTDHLHSSFGTRPEEIFKKAFTAITYAGPREIQLRLKSNNAVISESLWFPLNLTFQPGTDKKMRKARADEMADDEDGLDNVSGNSKLKAKANQSASLFVVTRGPMTLLHAERLNKHYSAHIKVCETVPDSISSGKKTWASHGYYTSSRELASSVLKFSTEDELHAIWTPQSSTSSENHSIHL